MAQPSTSQTLRFDGCTHFRQRVICSILSGKPIRISNIRSDDEHPGLHDFEASFLRLIDNLTNGTRIEINGTGTIFRMQPGIITGGNVTHDCGNSRSIGWFVEALIPLLVFGKNPTKLTLTGITNDNNDISVDTLKSVTIPLLAIFGVDGVELKVKKRGPPPNGGGLVEFSIPCVRELKTINYLDTGFVKRIRGVVYTAHVSPLLGNRVVGSSRSLFNRLIPDVYIFTDHNSGRDSGNSPGYGLSLVAETTTGVRIGIDIAAEQGVLPEDLGKLGAASLLEEIRNGGCVDSTNQSLALLLMVLCPEEVSRIRLGTLTQYTIQFLRHIQDFFGVVFRIRGDSETKTVLLSCLGIGYKNFAKKVT